MSIHFTLRQATFTALIATFAAAGMLLAVTADTSHAQRAGTAGSAATDRTAGSSGPVVRDHRGKQQQKKAPQTQCAGARCSNVKIRDHRKNARTFPWRPQSSGPKAPKNQQPSGPRPRRR